MQINEINNLFTWFLIKKIVFAKFIQKAYFCFIDSDFSMANEQILISGIEYKVRKLIDDNYRLKSENKSLQEKLVLITDKVNNLTKELETNKNELFKYTLANTLEIEFGVEEGKKKIDSLIKEIDMCIEVLSR